jgi:hypothetical protein
MSAGSRWIRLSVDWDGSDWLTVLSAESQLAWVKFLCYAKGYGTSGVLAKRSPITLSRIFGVGEESIRKMLAAAEAEGALIVDEKQWEVVAWRAYQIDNSRDRVRTHRERQRENPTNSEPDVTECNGYTTLRNGGNGDVTNVTANNDNDNDNKRKTTSFQKPSLEEIASYFSELGSSDTESEKFFDYYQANGWKVGRNPMRDWRATARNWTRRNPSPRKSNVVSFEEAKRLAR